jgi:hypothetical protein
VYNLKASAPSGWIAQDLNTHNLFDSSSVYLEITKGSLYFYPYSSSSPARAYASGYNDKTSAIQSADTGGSIVKSYASAAMVGFNPIARAL